MGPLHGVDAHFAVVSPAPPAQYCGHVRQWLTAALALHDQFPSNQKCAPLGGDHQMIKRFATPAALLLLLLVAGSFLYVQTTKALARTPCCGDDAYFSLVAKTLALRGSYSVPLSSETVSLFDPEITSGPGLILPGAAMIAVVGAQPWATSLTTILLFTATVTLMTMLLATRFQLANVFLYTALCVLALVAIMHRQDDAYFAFLGEAPAFGYLIVGCVLLATSRGQTSRVVLSALCISLALLTKHIALFCALGATGAWFLRELYLNRSRTIGLMGVFLVGVAGPFAIFEHVKASGLGLSAFIAHWRGYLGWISLVHVGPTDRLDVFLANINGPYVVTFSAALFALASLLLTALLSVRRGWRTDEPIFGLMLFAGAIVHFLYAFFISSLEPRYLWIGMAMSVFAVMSPVLFIRLRFALPVAVAALVFVATPSAVFNAYRIQLALTDGRLAHEREIVLREIANHPELPIVSQWWATIYDIIYLLNNNHPWYMTNDEHRVPTLQALFVTFDQFSRKTDPLYGLVHRLCERVHPELTLYKIFICVGGTPAAEPGT
jgi:hypothetical protein